MGIEEKFTSPQSEPVRYFEAETKGKKEFGRNEIEGQDFTALKFLGREVTTLAVAAMALEWREGGELQVVREPRIFSGANKVSRLRKENLDRIDGLSLQLATKLHTERFS